LFEKSICPFIAGLGRLAVELIRAGRSSLVGCGIDSGVWTGVAICSSVYGKLCPGVESRLDSWRGNVERTTE